jgi:formate--tetrahydrofolate ligase
MPSDLDIARQIELKPIVDVAASLDLSADDLESYGPYKAKLTFDSMKRITSQREHAKMILVTAMTPTPAGEGKSTCAIGLSQGLWKLGKRNVVAVREPSLGPVFGLKGGATGGGYAQVLPMEDINLHFTGDLHAITTAHNLLAALIDVHLQFGNELGIDVRTISFNRTLDLCDRALRNTVVGLGGSADGVPRETGFDITAASEVMAILTLSRDIPDLKARLSRMVVAQTMSGRPVTAGDLNAVGAMAATLRDAARPNIVQTVEGTPALVHCGPFGNVSFGCNSVAATHVGLHLGDYLVTEAGFGSDLGAEKFFNIKCRSAELMPQAVVVAGTIRAMKYQGGASLDSLQTENLEALKKGLPNLLKHVENMQAFGCKPVVGLNRFITDTQAEIDLVRSMVNEKNLQCALVDVWANGGEGGKELGEMVIEAVKDPGTPQLLYTDEESITDKIEKVAKTIYGAGSVKYLPSAKKKIAQFEAQGYGNLPVCIAKTQKSLSDVETVKGRPEGFEITVRNVKANTGAGYIVVYAGNIMTMFGMSAAPAAHNIDLTDDGEITGIF